MIATAVPVLVYSERLTISEEADFLELVNNAADAGDITPEEASQLIDREYEIMLLAK